MSAPRAAQASAEAGVLFTGITIGSGAIWGKPTWGTWWTWDARLTSVAVLFVMYLGYLLLRAMIEDRERAARYSAVLGILAALDIPLVYFSSAEVYGKSGVLSETTDIRVPARWNVRLEYALGKLTSEAMIANARAHGLRAVVVRPFNVVGPRQSSAGGFVMPSFVQQALANRALTVFESGSQQRAFTAVDDVVRFITDHVDDALASTEPVFNAGNPNNLTTIVALARRVIELLHSRSRIVYTDGKRVYGPFYCEAESFVKAPSIDAAARLGWAPRKSLDEIIVEVASYFEAYDPLRDHRPPRVAV